MPYGPEGDPVTAKIVFVGEAPSVQEMIIGRPFVGPAGRIFSECLEQAGILRSECYLTNVFQQRIKKKFKKTTIYDDNDQPLFYEGKRGFTELGREHLDILYNQLSKTNANIIVPMGSPAFRAICGKQGITKWRGSILKSSILGREDQKVVPTLHPANVIHGQSVMRYVILSDFKKVLRESEYPGVFYPKYQFKLNPTFSQCLEYLDFIDTLDFYTCDIEIGYVGHDLDPKAQCTRISFAWSDLEAISIPYADGNWTREEEAKLWLKTAQVLEKVGPTRCFHNGCFDIQFLLFIHKILIPPPYDDTMVAHHIVYPDFAKSLDFCASLHTDQPYWKDMVKHASIENPNG